MSYIGNLPTTQAFTPAVDYFSGNGSTTAFTLSRPVASVAQVQAVISNVPQNPGDAFTVNGNTITFTSAPPSGTNNIYVYYTSPITQVVTPSDGSVTASVLATNAVTPVKLSAGGPSWDTSGNVTLTGNITLNNGSADGAQLTLNSAGYSSWNWDNYNGSLRAYYNATEYLKVSATGDLQINSGYGSVATVYGCRAWVNFNGKNTIAIRSSGNVSSLTDNGVGNYTVNFTNALPDTNYAAIGTARYDVTGGGADYGAFLSCYSLNTSNVSIYTSDNASANTAEDEGLICVTIFR